MMISYSFFVSLKSERRIINSEFRCNLCVMKNVLFFTILTVSEMNAQRDSISKYPNLGCCLVVSSKSMTNNYSSIWDSSAPSWRLALGAWRSETPYQEITSVYCRSSRSATRLPTTWTPKNTSVSLCSTESRSPYPWTNALSSDHHIVYWRLNAGELLLTTVMSPDRFHWVDTAPMLSSLPSHSNT